MGMSRNGRRRIVTATLIFGVIGAWAPSIVDAHTEFEDAPASIAPDSDVALEMHVAHERGDGVYNVGVAIRLPEGWTGVACETKPTWTCAIATESQRDVIRFTKDEGAAPAEDESFNITLHSGTTIGTASFPTLQTYNTGEEVGWIGDPGSDEPAPTLELADASSPTVAPTTAVEPAPTTTDGSTTTVSPDTTVSPATTTAAGPTTTAEVTITGDTTVDTLTTLAPTATQPSETDSDDDNTALIVVIVLLVAAAAAGTVIYLRSRNTTPPVDPTV
jgi:Domain of unkown function (DUF1775)